MSLGGTNTGPQMYFRFEILFIEGYTLGSSELKYFIGGSLMQFGIFTIGDVTPDRATRKAPAQNQRITGTVKIAKHAERAGLELFATGPHRPPPFVAPGTPPALLSYPAAQTEKLILSTSTTLITTT